jgi:PAS domain S-box-containing protein
MSTAYPPAWDKLYWKANESLRIGLFRADADGNLVDADVGFVDLLHYPDLSSLVKDSGNIWARDEDREKFVQALKKGQAVNQWRVAFRRFDGTLAQVKLSIYAVSNEPGRACFFEGAIQQITRPGYVKPRQMKTASLIETNSRLIHALTSNLTDTLVVVDREGIILFYSGAPSQLVANSPSPAEDLKGKRFIEFIHPDDRLQAENSFAELMEKPGRPLPLLFRNLYPGGSWRWIEGKAINLLDDPDIQGIVLNFRDITEQKIAQQKLYEDEKELHYHAEFERLILGISTRLINVRTDEMIEELEKALAEIGRFTQVDRCHIFVFSAAQKTMSCLADWNREGLEGSFCDKLQDIPVDSTPSWLAKMQANEVIYFNSAAEIFQEEPSRRLSTRKLAEKSLIDVPIVSAGNLVGFMGLSTVREERQWTADEIGLQKLLAEIIANVLERRDAETRNRRRIEHLDGLLKVEKAITSKTEIGSVMNVILEQVTTQLGMDGAVILLFDAKTRSLYFGSGRGFKPGRATTALRYLQNPLLERVVAERQMLQMPIPHEWQDIWENEGFSMYFGVPLVAKGEVNGVLELYHRTEFSPSEDWLTFLFMIAEVSAIAIDNVSLFQNLQRSNRELQQAYDTTLEGWARALELRHQETKDHSTRIVNWVMRLGKQFGMDGEALVNLKRGALLHDIGKMGIPDAILNKTGPLVSEEWDVMKKHPQLAYDMLYPISYLRPALDIPYCHHEWWDGSGYPRGLRGEEIPLAARIFTVVDIWDALIQDRKYRPTPERRWDRKRAKAYLIEQSGKKLDPRVVKAFLHMLESESV